MACGFCGDEKADGRPFCPTCGRAPSAAGPGTVAAGWGSPTGAAPPRAGPPGAAPPGYRPPAYAPPGYGYGTGGTAKPMERTKALRILLPIVAVLLLLMVWQVADRVSRATDQARTYPYSPYPPYSTVVPPGAASPTPTRPPVVANRQPTQTIDLPARTAPGESLALWTPPVTAGNFVVGELIVVASDEGQLVAARPDGTIAWTRPAADVRSGEAPRLLPGSTDTVLVRGQQVLIAIDATTGADRWRRVLENGLTSFSTEGSLVAIDTPAGIDVVDLLTGEVRTHIDPADGATAHRVTFSADVLVGTAPGVLHAWEPSTGAERWSHTDLIGIADPRFCHEVVCAETAGQLRVYDRTNGALRTSLDLIGDDSTLLVVGVTDFDHLVLRSESRLHLFLWNGLSETATEPKEVRTDLHESTTVTVAGPLLVTQDEENDLTRVAYVDVFPAAEISYIVIGETGTRFSTPVLTIEAVWMVATDADGEAALVGYALGQR